MIQYHIIRDRWNLGADRVKSIYIAGNMAGLLESCKFISGKLEEISRPEIKLNLGLQVRQFYRIEVNTRSSHKVAIFFIKVAARYAYWLGSINLVGTKYLSIL